MIPTPEMLTCGSLPLTHSISIALGWLALVPAGFWMGTVGKSRYPGRWARYHRNIMLTAAAVIFGGAACGYMSNELHFSLTTEALGPILNSLLLLQVVIGMCIYFRHGEVWGILVQVHRLKGLVIYITGLIYGAMRMNAHSYELLGLRDRHMFTMGLGFLAAVELHVLQTVLPVWWGHFCGKPERYKTVKPTAGAKD